MQVRKCFNCGSRKTIVYKTIDKVDRVVRYRKCTKCNFSWNTVELHFDDYQDLLHGVQ